MALAVGVTLSLCLTRTITGPLTQAAEVAEAIANFDLTHSITVLQTADSATTANQLANSAADVAQRGGQVVAQVVTTMDDIFGTMVEFYANNANDAGDYLIGEKVMIGSPFLRSMMTPSADGGSSDCWYSGVGSLDVHYSSGVANHWFFLLAEGTNSSFGTSKTCVAGNTRVATGTGSLTGIGRDAAAKIWHRALTVKMTSNTNYAGARAAAISAANDLYGAGSTQANAVAAAWSAVGVN